MRLLVVWGSSNQQYNELLFVIISKWNMCYIVMIWEKNNIFRFEKLMQYTCLVAKIFIKVIPFSLPYQLHVKFDLCSCHFSLLILENFCKKIPHHVTNNLHVDFCNSLVFSRRNFRIQQNEDHFFGRNTLFCGCKFNLSNLITIMEKLEWGI